MFLSGKGYEHMNVPLRIRMGNCITEYELTLDAVHEDFINKDCCVTNRPNPRAVPFGTHLRTSTSESRNSRWSQCHHTRWPTRWIPGEFHQQLTVEDYLYLHRTIAWINDMWPEEATHPEHLQLVAADERTTFGCTRCGSVTVCGEITRCCISRCFDMPAHDEKKTMSQLSEELLGKRGGIRTNLCVRHLQGHWMDD